MSKFNISSISCDEGVLRILDIQNMLGNLTENEVISTAENIITKNYHQSPVLASLARNIYKLSSVRLTMASVFVNLVSILSSKCDIVESLKLQLFYGLRVEADRFIREMEAQKYFTNEEVKEAIRRMNINTPRDVYSGEESQIATIIEKDDIECLKNYFSDPTHTFNDKIPMNRKPYDFKSYVVQNPDISHDFLLYSSPTLIQYAALFGALKCFKYLYINNADLNLNANFSCFDFSITSFAVAGGNADIIQLIEERDMKIQESDIEYAIIHHRTEIFDWIQERYSLEIIEDDSQCYIENEFVHAVVKLKNVTEMALFGACFVNFIEFTKYWMKTFPNFKLSNDDPNNEFSYIVDASREGNYETVDFLINMGINVNEEACFSSFNGLNKSFYIYSS